MIYTDEPVNEGEFRSGRWVLVPEEALYLYEVRGKRISGLKEAIRRIRPYYYFAYRNIRDRGLFARFDPQTGSYMPAVNELASEKWTHNDRASGYRAGDFYVVDKREWYEKYWLGQWGIYKKGEGMFLFLDPFEWYYLWEKGWINEKRDPPPFYQLFKFWRDRGWVVKSGYKFGTVFRLYPPGARPGRTPHSSFLMEPAKSQWHYWELSRALRVAHGVKKGLLVEAVKESKTTDYI